MDAATTALGDLLDSFASADPLPGGGSAVALTGALGVSLLLMVASMDKTRSGRPEETADLAGAAARLRPLRDELTSLIDEDSRAYLCLIAAYRLPKTTDAEKAIRHADIQSAIRAATQTPLQTMLACERALRDAPVVARFGNPNAATDAAVGARLLVAAIESAGLNVDVNLRSVADAEFVRRSAGERQSLLASGTRLARQVADALRQ